jgi:hypothetical protein
MKVTELRKALENLPDDLVVVTDGGRDHSYTRVRWAHADKAELFSDGHLCEYFDEANLSGGRPIEVFVVGRS